MTTVMLGVPVVTASAQPAAAATGAPEGFVASLVLGKLDKVGAGGLPVGFAYAPDGRIFIARKTGVIDVWSGGVRKVFLDIQDEVNSRTGRGLLGIAIDPDYATNHRIFTLFTQELDPAHPDQDTPAGGKIISIRAKAGTPDVADPATRVTLLSGYQSVEREHSVGGLRFDAAGNLLATFGDAKLPGIDEGQALVALNLDDLRGKLIRIDRETGNGVAGNPYFNPANPGSVRSKVYARGFRNAYRFTVDPDNGTLYVGDVGWNTWEMLNVFPVAAPNPDKDRNAGWPCYEGGDGVALPQPLFQYAPVSQATCQTVYPPAQGGTGVGVSDPLYGYRHDDPGGENGSAITAGPKYTGTSNYPAEYIDKLFIGDYARDRFQIVDPITGDATNFGTPGDWGNPVDIQIAPDGNVAYLGVRSGELREIVYTGTNHAPLALAQADKTSSPTRPLTVAFTGHNSTDPDPGDTLTYDWDFNDGSAHSALADPSHKFSAKGSYNVTLTVSDGHLGGTVSTSLWIDVANTPPTVALAAPLPSFRYSVGDTIDIDLTATDTEDGTLTGASIFSEVRMIHLGHFHPVTEFSGATSSFLAEDHGSDDTYYQVISTATDAFGRSTTTTADILPEKRTVTVTSVPAGATISLDGVQRTTPYSWLSIVGGHHEMEAPADLLSGALPYAFDQWVHGQKTGNEQYFTFDTSGHGAKLTANYAPTTPGFSISDASIVEGDSGKRTVAVDVSLTSVPNAPVSVGFTTADAPGANLASASADYDPVSGTLNFPAGVDTRTIGIAITGDQLVEGAEHFRVELQNASGAPIVDGIADMTIVDDDVASDARLSVGDVKILETNDGTPNATMTVSLSAPSAGGVSVHYATLDGTAKGSSDYSPRSGTITFASGETAKTIPIPVNGDGRFEASETFTLKLTNAVGAATQRSLGTVRIANDDAGPALAVSDTSVVEGDTGTSYVGFSITLSTPASQTVSVTYAVNHTTTNAGDIDLKSATVSIPAGRLGETFQVRTFADTTPEPNETFSVTLSNPVNATLADASGTGTVINDDPGSGRRIAIGDSSLNEGNDGGRLLRFTVTCSTPSSTALKVSYATGGGSASGGGDYGAKSGTVTIRAGETSASVTIKIKGDAVPEPDETFRVTLSNPGAGATITRAVGTGTIRTDD